MSRVGPGPGEPFNRLYDVARLRGLRLGLAVGGLVGKGTGLERRPLQHLEVRIDGRDVIAPEPIGTDLNHAAARMLARLPSRGGR